MRLSLEAWGGIYGRLEVRFWRGRMVFHRAPSHLGIRPNDLTYSTYWKEKDMAWTYLP